MRWDPDLTVDESRPVGPALFLDEELRWLQVERMADVHPVLGLFGLGSGPTILLDKSTFQSLNYHEHTVLHRHFTQSVVPILIWEILGDLAKNRQSVGDPEATVRALAAKFGGAGTPLHKDCADLCLSSLLGRAVPLNGQMVASNAKRARLRNGTLGLVVKGSPINDRLTEWRQGHFTEFERGIANLWRPVAKNLDISLWEQWLNKEGIVIPRSSDVSELNFSVLGVLNNLSLQSTMLSWLLRDLGPSLDVRISVRQRWSSLGKPPLKEFAPYAWFYLRAQLTAMLATRDVLVAQNPTNLLDAHYLYYLPFCHAFASNDKLHLRLAPLLLREDQILLGGTAIKDDLALLYDFYCALTAEQREMLGFALWDRPPPRKGSVIHELFEKRLGRWRPGKGNLATGLDDRQRRIAMAWVEKLYRKAEGDSYFDKSSGGDAERA